MAAERVRWRAVLTRLAANVQSLAVQHLAHTETLLFQRGRTYGQV